MKDFVNSTIYKEGKNKKLPKDEVYKFGTIVDLFNLRRNPPIEIRFNKFQKLHGNCLITNGEAYSDAADVRLLQKLVIKEVENFGLNLIFNVVG